MNKGTLTLALGFFSLAASLFCADAPAQQSVNLSAVDNRYGIAGPGTAVTNGGVDGYGYAYAANLLGASLSFAGQTFVFGAPGPHSAVTSRVIPLPAGKDASLSFLATGVDGNQPNQTFIVTYTDGSKTSFTQSLSDWYTPQRYPGESIALATPYRITSSGSKQAGTFNVYGYTFALNSAKTVQSLTLPTNQHVVVVAIDVTPVSTPVTLSAIDNVYGIARPGSAVTGGGVDGYGYAYAANLLGTSLTWSGETFSIGVAGPKSAATGKVIPLPAGKDVSLSFLATGVDGNQANQTFVVTYTDGSKTSFTRSLSDWHTPQHYPGESIALTTAYRITANGAQQAGTFDVYGYTLGLDGAKTVQSLTLPNNRNVVVLAVDVTPAAGISMATATPPMFGLPSGTYLGQQFIALADSTPGAIIYFTTDGTTPTPASLRYTSPIEVFGSHLGNSVTTTIKAIAVASGYLNSAVASASYTINLYSAFEPSFWLVGLGFDGVGLEAVPGIYGKPYLVQVPPPFPAPLLIMRDATPSPKTIYYSIDGGSAQVPPKPGNVYTGPLSLQEGSVNRVSAQTVAAGFVDSSVNTQTYYIPVFPSDALFPGEGNFLYNAPQDGCAYYQAVGAVTGDCTLNADGSLANGITFEAWLAARFTPLQDAGGLTGQATFVNVMDLNFTRNHQAVWNQQTGTNNASAAYVCNSVGPDFYHDIPTDHYADVSTAIDRGKPLPCVAIDYGVIPGVNGNDPFMRFLVFDSASHHLLPTVDLDFRGQKSVPNACSACHGIPVGAALPTAGYQKSARPSYIAFDEQNLRFSFETGLTFAVEEPQLKNLNLIVLNGQDMHPANPSTKDPGGPSRPGGPLDQLIRGWYGALLDSPSQQSYVPIGWNGSADDVSAYQNVYAPYCRSCHVSNGVQYPSADTNYFPPTTPGDLKSVFLGSGVCNPQATAQSFALMPNAKVTFDRLWTTHVGPGPKPGTDLPNFLRAYLGLLSCDLPPFNSYPNQIP